jgi:hypothetical protein
VPFDKLREHLRYPSTSSGFGSGSTFDTLRQAQGSAQGESFDTLSPTFDINQSYVQLLGNWGMLVMSFYFGSRGIEKIVDIAGKYRKEKG